MREGSARSDNAFAGRMIGRRVCYGIASHGSGHIANVAAGGGREFREMRLG
jgi:hypothetical protein